MFIRFNKREISSVRFLKNNFPINPSNVPENRIIPLWFFSKSSILQWGSSLSPAFKKDFEVLILTTNKNVNLVIKQAQILKVKNIIISSKTHYLKATKIKNKNFKIHNNLDDRN